MIPLIDDYLQMYIVEKLTFLKKHPTLIDEIFSTGRRETLKSLKDFITKQPVRVLLGYPQDAGQLPAYVITLAPEQEVPIGLGDGFEEYYEDIQGGTEEEKAKGMISQFIQGTYMSASYRIECWSQTGDLTTYMYAILKWILWTSRKQMLSDGWVNITFSGTDLEPVPDYMPVFVYRRAGLLNLQYENNYYRDISSIEKYVQIIDDFHKSEEDPEYNSRYEIIYDDDGNPIYVIDKETGEKTQIMYEDEAFILLPSYYSATLKEEYHE